MSVGKRGAAREQRIGAAGNYSVGLERLVFTRSRQAHSRLLLLCLLCELLEILFLRSDVYCSFLSC